MLSSKLLDSPLILRSNLLELCSFLTLCDFKVLFCTFKLLAQAQYFLLLCFHCQLEVYFLLPECGIVKVHNSGRSFINGLLPFLFVIVVDLLVKNLIVVFKL